MARNGKTTLEKVAEIDKLRNEGKTVAEATKIVQLSGPSYYEFKRGSRRAKPGPEVNRRARKAIAMPRNLFALETDDTPTGKAQQLAGLLTRTRRAIEETKGRPDIVVAALLMAAEGKRGRA